MNNHQWQPGQRARVTRAYTAQYADPIAFRAGDRLIVGANDTEWPAFVCCTGPDGRSGWTPDRLIERDRAGGVARADYSALELTVVAGETVTILEEEGGWIRVTNSAGATGWVPVEHFSPAL